MNEKQIIKKQLLVNILYNLIAFSIIFAIFGVVIFNQVKNSLYSSVDKEILSSKERMHDGNFKNFSNRQDKSGLNGQNLEIIKEPINNIELSPRIINITRDKDGNITNSETLGNFYDTYLINLEFDKNNIDSIFDIKIGNSYFYRGITISITDENNEITYVQLLMNVDGEVNLIENFFEILLIGISISVIFSIIASYILSKKSLSPIVSSWKKQIEFVQNASHELRTPLTIIQTKQELLLRSPESKIIDKSEDIILTLDETKRLSKLTTDLMTLARADSSNQQIEKENINIDELIRNIINPYLELAQMQNKNIIFNLNINKIVMLDKNRINQLIIILLDNAIKYTEENDTIEIKTEIKDKSITIEVKDTGIGISNKGLKHVFERFYRDDEARNRKSGGTGLGLSIAKWIVDMHGGTIKATKNANKGTIFIVRLPK